MNNHNYKIYASISYRHRDMAVAISLQKNLESFKFSTEVYNDIAGKSRYLRPIFHDQSDLNTGMLGDELDMHLEESKFLANTKPQDNPSNSSCINKKMLVFKPIQTV